MSKDERKFFLDPQLPVASLTNTKKRQVVRLVNASDTKIGFVLTLDAQTNSSIIEPRSGFISARSYVHIVIDIQGTTAGSLNIVYWMRDTSRKRGYTRRLIPIQIINSGEDKRSFIWFIVRAIRASFIIALILYNITLIMSR